MRLAMRGRALIRALFVSASLVVGPAQLGAQSTAARERVVVIDSGRFRFEAGVRNERLARSLFTAAIANDTFPGLPRPQARVTVVVADNDAEFRALVGPNAPEWGAAIAFPDEHRIVMQGRAAGSDAGDPRVVVRHELAHLALHEAMGPLPPRWFDEGYASVSAGEWTREQTLETSLGLVWHTLPSRDSLESGFYAGSSRAEWSYAIAHRVVAELAMLDEQNGLRNFFTEWKSSGSFEVAVRRAYGMTGLQFDERWHSHVRRQYGALSFVANLSLVGGVFAILLGPLFWMRRRRDRRRLEAMRASDAAQEAEQRASALEALLNAADSAIHADGTPDGRSSDPTDKEELATKPL